MLWLFYFVLYTSLQYVYVFTRWALAGSKNQKNTTWRRWIKTQERPYSSTAHGDCPTYDAQNHNNSLSPARSAGPVTPHTPSPRHHPTCPPSPHPKAVLPPVTRTPQQNIFLPAAAFWATSSKHDETSDAADPRVLFSLADLLARLRGGGQALGGEKWGESLPPTPPRHTASLSWTPPRRQRQPRLRLPQRSLAAPAQCRAPRSSILSGSA